MKIIENIVVPTGNILIVEGEYGKLEMLSLGDYGKDHNLKCDAIGLSRELTKVEHAKLLPLEEKWVITISSQYGCICDCKFCSPAGTKVNTPYGERDIETLRKDDLVIGHNGVCPVISKIDKTFSRDYNGNLICLELENGETIKLTPNHEVCTTTGFKRADELTDSDELIEF